MAILETLMQNRTALENQIASMNQAIVRSVQAEEDAVRTAQEAAALQKKANIERNQAEQVKRNNLHLYAAGSLNITARDNIGSEKDALEVSAGGLTGGTTDITSRQGDVYLAYSAHSNLGKISGENVTVTTSGDIRPVTNDSGIYTGFQDDPETLEDESKAETKAVVNALGSSIGTDSKSVNVDADRISGTSGDNVNILALRDVAVDELTVGGSLKLTTSGNLLAGKAEEGAANITGSNIQLNAGNVGTGDSSLTLDIIAQNSHNAGLSANVNNIFVQTLGDALIRDVNAENVIILSNGCVFGASDNGNDPDIDCTNLIIRAMNGVGTKDNPLVIYVRGIVDITSLFGSIFVRRIVDSGYEFCEDEICGCKHPFWNMVVKMIREAEAGATVEIQQIVPCGRMPAKVMRVLCEREDVTLILHLRDGSTLVIEAGEALDPAPYVECYDLNWLVKYYMETAA